MIKKYNEFFLNEVADFTAIKGDMKNKLNKDYLGKNMTDQDLKFYVTHKPKDFPTDGILGELRTYMMVSTDIADFRIYEEVKWIVEDLIIQKWIKTIPDSDSSFKIPNTKIESNPLPPTRRIFR